MVINNGIMIDAGNEILKKATDEVMAMLQSDMKNISSTVQSAQIINKQNWQKFSCYNHSYVIRVVKNKQLHNFYYKLKNPARSSTQQGS